MYTHCDSLQFPSRLKWTTQSKSHQWSWSFKAMATFSLNCICPRWHERFKLWDSLSWENKKKMLQVCRTEFASDFCNTFKHRVCQHHSEEEEVVRHLFGTTIKWLSFNEMLFRKIPFNDCSRWNGFLYDPRHNSTLFWHCYQFRVHVQHEFPHEHLCRCRSVLIFSICRRLFFIKYGLYFSQC